MNKEMREYNQEFEVEYKNSIGETKKEKFDVTLDVECDVWIEECHGYHRMVYPNERSVERAIKVWLDTYDIEEIPIDDIVEIVKIEPIW